jgi:hypothetical protein
VGEVPDLGHRDEVRELLQLHPAQGTTPEVSD